MVELEVVKKAPAREREAISADGKLAQILILRLCFDSTPLTLLTSQPAHLFLPRITLVLVPNRDFLRYPLDRKCPTCNQPRPLSRVLSTAIISDSTTLLSMIRRRLFRGLYVVRAYAFVLCVS
jgi:hypothetical protein